MIVRAFVCALALVLVPVLAHAEGETIVEIDVVENSKTDDETVKLIARVKKGQRFDAAKMAEIQTNLINSGLFKDVSLFTSPAVGGVKLTIVAREKHSWIVGPTFYNQPGNVGGGLGFGEANLFGENKKLLLYGQVATADSMFIAAYVDPNIANTRFYWMPLIFLRREIVTEYAAPTEFFQQPDPIRESVMHYLNGGVQVGVEIWQGLKFDVRLRGAYIYYRDSLDPRTGEPVIKPQDDGWDVSTEVRLSRDKRANWHGVQDGSLFEVTYERGLPELGSKNEYWMLRGRWTLAWRFWGEHNFLMKNVWGYGDDLPFQQEFTSGDTGLRGYLRREFRGDLKLGTQMEYLFPLFKIQPFAFRGLLFVDSAYTTFVNDEGNDLRHYVGNQTDTSINQWRTGIGAGFRVYVKAVVLPLLGLDFGYGPQDDDFHILFALGLLEL